MRRAGWGTCQDGLQFLALAEVYPHSKGGGWRVCPWPGIREKSQTERQKGQDKHKVLKWVSSKWWLGLASTLIGARWGIMGPSDFNAPKMPLLGGFSSMSISTGTDLWHTRKRSYLNMAMHWDSPWETGGNGWGAECLGLTTEAACLTWPWPG